MNATVRMISTWRARNGKRIRDFGEPAQIDRAGQFAGKRVAPLSCELADLYPSISPIQFGKDFFGIDQKPFQRGARRQKFYFTKERADAGNIFSFRFALAVSTEDIDVVDQNIAISAAQN